MKPIRAAELMIEKIKKDYPEDVSIFIIHGSTIYKDTHHYSDLDMFFVPKTARGFQLGFTCIIDEIGYDFWALDWKRLERIANHEERIVSIITEGQIVYCNCPEDLARWETLRKKALDTENKPRLLSLAQQQLESAAVDVVTAQLADSLSGIRASCIGFLYKLGHSLALLNGTSIKRGRKYLLQELLEMPFIPESLAPLYTSLFFSKEREVILQALLQLWKNSCTLLTEVQNSRTAARSFRKNWQQAYEELINFYNKIYRAAEADDPVTAIFAAAEIRHEIQEISAYTGVSLESLPDLCIAYDPEDLSKIRDTARIHQGKMESLLTGQGVTILRLADEEALRAFLAKL